MAYYSIIDYCYSKQSNKRTFKYFLLNILIKALILQSFSYIKDKIMETSKIT